MSLYWHVILTTKNGAPIPQATIEYLKENWFQVRSGPEPMAEDTEVYMPLTDKSSEFLDGLSKTSDDLKILFTSEGSPCKTALISISKDGKWWVEERIMEDK